MFMICMYINIYIHSNTHVYILIRILIHICIHMCVYCNRRIGGAAKPVANPALRGRL